MSRLNRHVKKWVLPSLLCLNLVLFVFGLLFVDFVPRVAASPETVVGIDPAVNSANPSQFFTINVNVTDVTDLFRWQIKMRWTRGLLRTEANNITQGPFLRRGTEYAFFLKSTNGISELDAAENLAFTTTGTSGSGTLMSVKFRVERAGNTTLEIYFSELANSTDDLISHSVENATFYTTFPVADFTYTPHPLQYLGRPIVGETVTFNGTLSYDPDQSYKSQTGSGIDSYSWDFGDGYNGTGAMINHTFSAAGSYIVSLNVTDDDGEKGFTNTDTYGNPSVIVKLHDIAVINVTVTPKEVAAGGTVTINATVLNKGSHGEHFNITAYYNLNPYFNYVPIEMKYKTNLPKGENITFTFSWDTTGIAGGNYTIAVDTFLIDQLTLEARLGEEADLTDNGLTDGLVTVTGTPWHDLAVTEIKVSPTDLKVNQASSIEVKVKNEGNLNEYFNLTVTVYNSSGVFTTKLWSNETLLAGLTDTYQFNWLLGGNGTKEGTYNVTASIVLINSTTLDFLSPYNASTPDDDPDDNELYKTPLPIILMLPVAHFTTSATQIKVDQTLIFNATLSYTPGVPTGSITKYAWNFGDGVKVTQTSPIITHIYRTNGTYTVILTVTDDASKTGNVTKLLTINPFRIIAITNVTFSPNILTSGGSATINVTVNARLPTPTSTQFNITVYFDGNEIDTLYNQTLQYGNSATFTFPWNTTGISAGNYTIKAFVINQLNSTHTENTTYIAGTITIQEIPVQEVAPPSPFLYTTVVLIIVIAVMAVYFIKFWKPKPK